MVDLELTAGVAVVGSVLLDIGTSLSCLFRMRTTGLGFVWFSSRVVVVVEDGC